MIVPNPVQSCFRFSSRTVFPKAIHGVYWSPSALQKYTWKHLVLMTQPYPHWLDLNYFCIERSKNWNLTVTMPGRKCKFTKDLVEKHKCFCNSSSVISAIAARGLYFSTSVFSNLLQFFNFRQKHELAIVQNFLNEFLHYTRASI